jgi:hypothetical protein
MTQVLKFLPAAFLLWTVSVHAQSEAMVEGMQLPAWLERGDSESALEPGMALRSGDRLITGDGARLLVRTPDGSHVKLGEQARFVIETVVDNSDAGGVFEGAMSLLKGAFRFTTSALGQTRSRKVDISVGTATIGIRGTDVWGKSTDEQDLIVLLEGQIEVTREGEAPVSMTDPLSVYTAPKDAPANPLSTIAESEVPPYAAETELTPGQGVLREDGEYRLYLQSSQNVTYAENAVQRYREAGYPATVTQHQVEGATWNRIGIDGFISPDDAEAFAEQIRGRLGTGNPWVDKLL